MVVPPPEERTMSNIPAFTKRWDELGLSVETDLLALQHELASAPTAAMVVRGTKSIRRIHFAPLSWKGSKRGPTRLLYVYFKTLETVILAAVCTPDEPDRLSTAVKAYLNEIIERLESDVRAGAENRNRPGRMRRNEKAKVKRPENMTALERDLIEGFEQINNDWQSGVDVLRKYGTRNSRSRNRSKGRQSR